jgi:hypothetical protein
MSTDLLKAAQAEEQRLVRELESTPLFRRLEAVRAVLRAYQDPPEAFGRPTVVVRSARPVSLTSQVIAIAQEHLRKQQRRAQSLEILHAVQGRGIEVPGDKPTTIVASILSHSDLFDNVRGQGYGLTEWTAAPPAGESGPTESGGQVGDDQTDQPEHQDDIDNGARSALQSNGATTGQGSWPRFSS